MSSAASELLRFLTERGLSLRSIVEDMGGVGSEDVSANDSGQSGEPCDGDVTSVIPKSGRQGDGARIMTFGKKVSIGEVQKVLEEEILPGASAEAALLLCQLLILSGYLVPSLGTRRRSLRASFSNLSSAQVPSTLVDQAHFRLFASPQSTHYMDASATAESVRSILTSTAKHDAHMKDLLAKEKARVDDFLRNGHPGRDVANGAETSFFQWMKVYAIFAAAAVALLFVM